VVQLGGWLTAGLVRGLVAICAWPVDCKLGGVGLLIFGAGHDQEAYWLLAWACVISCMFEVHVYALLLGWHCFGMIIHLWGAGQADSLLGCCWCCRFWVALACVSECYDIHILFDSALASAASMCAMPVQSHHVPGPGACVHKLNPMQASMLIATLRTWLEDGGRWTCRERVVIVSSTGNTLSCLFAAV
jgi:hypothetical protein